jgi:hypothetical protein
MKAFLSVAWTCTFLAAVAPRYASAFTPNHGVFARKKIISRPFGRVLASSSDKNEVSEPFGSASYESASFDSASYFNTPDIKGSERRTLASSSGKNEESLDTASYFNDDMLKSAYDGWRSKYSKNFDLAGFKNFKSNYLTIMDANIAAEQKALEAGKGSPRWITLNEYGDLSLDEYKVVQEALGKAEFDTFQMLPKQATKIGEDESEGRWDPIRRIYSDWCKQYEKEPDESRYPTFSTNFLALAQHCSNTGTEITLNEYADCTQDEYLELSGGDSEEIGKYCIPASWSLL